MPKIVHDLFFQDVLNYLRYNNLTHMDNEYKAKTLLMPEWIDIFDMAKKYDEVNSRYVAKKEEKERKREEKKLLKSTAEEARRYGTKFGE